MRPHGTPEQLERRRQRAFALLEQGMSMKVVAQRLGSSYVSVFRWRASAAQGGVAALEAKPVPGRPARLSQWACNRLLDLLLEGALSYGFPNELWTLQRIASVIEKEFGVRYHPNHVWRILRGANWSCQVPERRAIQRDDEAIEHWKRYKWPQIKKSPKTWGPSRLPR
jgi:transposase